jgi:hypothetical protein
MPFVQPPVKQASQASPPVPQAATEAPAVHAPFAQQPVAQLVPSQAQEPSMHLWPLSQAGPAPQVHEPSVEQASAALGSQLTHAVPPLPQVSFAGTRQKPPAQHPVGQEVASQVPGSST